MRLFAWPSAGRRAGNRHRPDQRQTGRQQGAYRRHRRPQVAELAHLMPMQLITPEGFSSRTAAPDRRAFLDWECFITKPDSSPPEHLKRLSSSATPRCVRSAVMPSCGLRDLNNPAGGRSAAGVPIQRRYRRRHGDICQQFLPDRAHLLFPARLGKETDYAEASERNFERDKR